MFGMFGAFDPQFYPKIARQSIGKSVGFLVVFAVIISALVSVKYTFVAIAGLNTAKKWVGDTMPKISSEFPVITMNRGALEEPKQAFIRDYQKQFAVIIEPDAEKVRSDMESFPNLVILTQRQLLTKQTAAGSVSAEIKTYDLDNKSFSITPGTNGFKAMFEGKEFELTPQMINRWIDIVSMFVFPVLLVFWFLAYSFTKPLHVFIYSLVSLIIVSILKTKLSYKEIWNIGAYALVPATCVAALFDIIGFRVLFFPLFYSLICCVYLYLGINAVTVQQAQPKA